MAILPSFLDAAGSGRFFTRWSALASFLVAAVLLVPVLPSGIEGYADGMAASALGWFVLAAPVLLIAAAERRLARRPARVALVCLTLLAIAVARPFVNELVVRALFGVAYDGALLTRVGTNLLSVTLLFSFVAVITTQTQQTRATAERLALALGRFEVARRELDDDERDARHLIDRTVDDLRAERDNLLDGPLDFDHVRDYSNLVRSASHRLAELARVPAPVPPATTDTAPARPPAPRFVDALVPTPFLIVGALYAFACAPFVVANGSPWVFVAAMASVLVIDVLAGLLLRGIAARSSRARAAAFLIVWMCAGALAAAVGAVLLPGSGLLLLVPFGALPLAAVVLAVTLDARRRAREQERASTEHLARAARDLTERTLAAREPLRHAAGTLHGRVQGRCVIFAALVDEEPPTAQDAARFRAETDAALDAVLAARTGANPQSVDELRRTLAGWQPLMRLDTDVADDVATALEDPETVAAVAELVNEALVNAVKHSGARAARIHIASDDRDGVGRRTGVHVRVSAPGELPRAVMPTRTLGGRALLYQDGDDVVLESTVPSAGSLAASA